MKNISLAILAGGKASRLNGIKKYDILINEERIIDRQSRILKSFFDDICIVSNEKIKNISYCIYEDLYKNIGPIGGIYTALFYCKTDYAFIISADMPFIDLKIVNLLIKKAEKNFYDVIVPTHKKGIEPLHAIYSKKILAVVENNILKNIYSVRSFFDKVDTLYLEIPETFFIEKAFFNINYPEDIQKAYLYENNNDR